MGLFDNNISTPPSIEQVCMDLKHSFDEAMDLDKELRRKLGISSPSSVDVEKILTSLVLGEYKGRLENNEVYAWQVNAIKKTSGHAHISYIVNFVIYSRLGEMSKMFQYEYIWR